jgi:WD40 repeat protein
MESLQNTVRYINLDDPATWKDKQGEGRGSSLRATSLSADGKLVVTADDGGTVRVWQVDKPDRPFAVLRGHEGQVYAASFSPDGKFIATAGSDGTARIWRVDEPMAIATHEDGSLPDWTTCLDELTELARKTAGRNLTSEEWWQFFPDAEYRPTFPDLPAPKTEKQD